jgi:hypothetical protein
MSAPMPGGIDAAKKSILAEKSARSAEAARHNPPSLLSLLEAMESDILVAVK